VHVADQKKKEGGEKPEKGEQNLGGKGGVKRQVRNLTASFQSLVRLSTKKKARALGEKKAKKSLQWCDNV